MISIILLVCIAALKVYKKSAPNGKVTIYLGKRNFVDFLDRTDPIQGVVVIENDYLQGRKLFGQLTTTYRYGREEDEVMGLKFNKELILAREQIAPASVEMENLSLIQERLIKKFSSNAYPFSFNFPANSPSSVTLQTGESTIGKPLGVHYTIKCLVGDNEKERGHKRSSVSLVIKKLQYAPVIKNTQLPSSILNKDFTFGNGRLTLEINLDKELYYHGEALGVNVTVTNNSRKTVKNIKCYVVQHCEVTMINMRYSKYVASLETRDGCPITFGNSFSKKFTVVPLASCNKDKFGVALDGYLKDEDVNLASSTLVPEGTNHEDAVGIVVKYSVRVKLHCGTLGGEVTTDVPFKLMHPAPGSNGEMKLKTLKKIKSVDKSSSVNNEENIIFEDFSKMRASDEEE